MRLLQTLNQWRHCDKLVIVRDVGHGKDGSCVDVARLVGGAMMILGLNSVCRHKSLGSWSIGEDNGKDGGHDGQENDAIYPKNQSAGNNSSCHKLFL